MEKFTQDSNFLLELVCVCFQMALAVMIRFRSSRLRPCMNFSGLLVYENGLLARLDYFGSQLRTLMLCITEREIYCEEI